MTRLPSQQSGAVLLVALVILGITTLLGVAVMQGATMESKMATNTQERQQAFSAAEAALRTAENFVSSQGFADTDLRTNSNCSSGFCFNSTCTGGYCFAGTFFVGDSQDQCATVPTGTPPPAVGVWADPALNVWSSGKYIKVNLPGYPAGVAGKYIVEFRCFTDQIDDGTGTAGTVASGSGDAVFRITARGSSESGRVEAMVQSTYRAPAPN